MSELASLLVSVLGVFALALLVRLLVHNRDRVAFASVLVLIGVIVSAIGLSFDLDLTAGLILMVFLPAIIFQGTTTLDVRRLWRNASLISIRKLVVIPVSQPKRVPPRVVDPVPNRSELPRLTPGLRAFMEVRASCFGVGTCTGWHSGSRLNKRCPATGWFGVSHSYCFDTRGTRPTYASCRATNAGRTVAECLPTAVRNPVGAPETNR